MRQVTAVALFALVGCGRIGFAPEERVSELEAPSTIELASGMSHVCARTAATGDVACWGDNQYGQLGLGSTTNALVPTSIGAGWDAISAGKLHTCGLRSGELWCWGENTAGQLGLGFVDSTPHTSPERVGGEARWSAVSAGRYHTCAIKDDRSLWCWGDGSDGGLGTGGTQSYAEPTRALGDDWVTIRNGGGYGGVAQRADGSTWVWGENSRGELGLADVQLRARPVDTTRSWQYAAGGIFVTCGIDLDGALWCWGRNDHGELGLGDRTDRWTPTLASNDTTWASVTPMEGFFTCAIDVDGALYCWGANPHGGLGVGDSLDRAVPTRVTAIPDGWQQVRGGGGGTETFACGVNDDQLYCWGSNMYGQLGVGTLDTFETPQRVTLP